METLEFSGNEIVMNGSMYGSSVALEAGARGPGGIMFSPLHFLIKD